MTGKGVHMNENILDRILYSDSDILVASKPSGLLSQASGNGDSFPELIGEALEQKHGKKVTLFTVHRLDRETEGLIVYALSSAAAASLSLSLSSDEKEKIYAARICGIPERSADTLCDLLFYDKSKNKSYTVKKERKGVKHAELRYTLENTFSDGSAEVRIKLVTGRTHQIRVQFASRGLPLVGDRRYGAPAAFGSRLHLCACAITFKHPRTNELLNFEISPFWEA